MAGFEAGPAKPGLHAHVAASLVPEMKHVPFPEQGPVGWSDPQALEHSVLLRRLVLPDGHLWKQLPLKAWLRG